MTKMKKYNIKNSEVQQINEPFALYLSGSKGSTFFDTPPSTIRGFLQKGVGISFFNRLQDFLGFSEETWADILSLSPKSIQRYKKNKDFKFKPIHSEKLLEIAEVLDTGREVFGDSGKFHLWLNTPCYALNNQKPVDLISDSYGKQMVIEELMRIEHGIFV